MADDLRKEVIISIKTDASDAGQGINEVQDGLNKLNNTPIDKTLKEFKVELKEALKTAEQIGDQFGQNSIEFENAVGHVSDLRNNFQRLNGDIEGFNPENKLEALVQVGTTAVGTTQAVAGAMANLGIQTEDTGSVLETFQGLLEFSEAIESVGAVRSQFNNFNTVIQSSSIFQRANAVATNIATGAMRIFGVAANATSTAFQALKGAIAATGIGLLAIAIQQLLPIITNWISGTDDAEEAQQRLKKAVSELNDELAFNKNAIEQNTALNAERLKQAGATEQDLFDNRLEGLKKQYQAERENEQKQRTLYNSKKLTEEEYTEASKALKQSIGNQIKISQSIELEEAKNKTRMYQDGVKQQKDLKDQAERNAKDAESRSKAARDKAKALNDKILAERKAALDELAKLEKEALENIEKSKLSDREKELFDLNKAFQEKKAKYIKYGKDVTAITEDYNIKKRDVEEKYSGELTRQLEDVLLNDFDKQRSAIKAKYDVLLENAKNLSEQLIVESLRAKENSRVDIEQTTKNNTINSETNFVDSENANLPSDKDSPEQRIQKLQNIYEAERGFKEAKLAEELAALESDENSKANVLAKYRLDELKSEQELSDAKKAISDAEKEAKLANASAIGKAAGDLSNILGQQTVAGKSLAIAQATIDTYVGATKALAQGGFLGIATAGIVAAAGFLNVKKIINTKVPTKNGGGSIGGVAPQISSAPVINAALTSAANGGVQDVRVTNSQDQVVKAYITDRDLENSQRKSQFLNNLSSF